MYSDHFLHASNLVISALSILITAMIKHGITSSFINKAVIKPIPKNKQKSLADSSNYRAICKNSIISKIIDYVLINELENRLATSSYQFAYKSGLSTSLCSFLMAETIQYYRSRGSNVYMLSLDATKAFDRVQYSKLFKLLISREVCPLIIRFILNIYLISSAVVKWNEMESKAFSISNGVKQGAVISAPLFALYINPLLDKLQKCKKGCQIGNLCANAFAYADDVVLLSPTCKGLKSMISICENFAYEYKLKFNPEKCILLIFADSEYYYENTSILLCGQKVKNVKTEKHLGHVFENSYDLINIESIIKDIKVRSNVIMNKFRPVSLLFNSQCSSLYGCSLWRLDSAKIDRLCTDWNICCIKILGLHPQTRSYLIPLIMDILPIKNMIMNRILNFFIAGIHHDSTLIANFFKDVLLSTSSHMSTNIQTILKYLDIKYSDFLDLNRLQTKQLFKNKSEEPDWRSGIIKELLTIRENQLYTNMTQGEVKMILDFASTLR